MKSLPADQKHLPQPSPGAAASARSKRKSNHRTFYFRNPAILHAFQAAIEMGVIRAKSASARLETLIKQDLRRRAKEARTAGVALPAGIFN